MRFRKAALVGAAIVSAGLIAAGAAQAQNEQFIPGLVYRTGAYAPNGIPFADGVADYINMINAREHLMQLMDDAGHKGTRREIVPTLFPGTAKHYGGAARMHASPKFGVTDAFSRLHEISNVFVVDASCFTTGAEKNPTLTVMALAARSADRLARDLRAM